MIDRFIRILDALVTREALLSRCRVNGVPYWPWDSNADLRRRLDCAMMFGYPSERADPHWLASVEGRMMLAELRLMRALGVARDGGGA